MSKMLFVKVPDEGINNNYNQSHIKVLYALCRYFCYFKENRINNFTVKELAELCQKTERRIYASLKYLRKKKLIIKIGRYEYINPFICNRCSDNQLRLIVENIFEPAGFSEGTLKPAPIIFEYDFRNVIAAKEEFTCAEDNWQSSLKPLQKSNSPKSFYEKYNYKEELENEEDLDYDDDSENYDDE